MVGQGVPCVRLVHFNIFVKTFRPMSHLIAPSILAADFANLERDITMLDKSKADWIHIDVMDGHFVPNISFGMPVIKAIRPFTDKVFDVHLMISDPDAYLEDFKKCGADLISVHYETVTHLHRTIQAIKALSMKAGVVLNPHTPVSVLEEIAPSLDLVLIMSVNPGYGGQSFIPESVQKVAKMKELLVKTGSKALIEVDGGVTADNARSLVDAGADVLVAGSFVFKSDDPSETISLLKDC